MTSGGTHDPYAALRNAGYRRLWGANVCSALGLESLTVAVGWEIYKRTNNAMALGLVGLVQFLPVLLLALPAGVAADRFNRKWQFVLAQSLAAMAAGALAIISVWRGPLLLIYVVLTIIGIARAFTAPARQALMPQFVPRELFSNAVAWGSGGWQVASTVGPMLGGFLMAATGRYVETYIVAAMFNALSAMLIASSKPRAVAPVSGQHDLKSLVAGVRFVWNTRLILATITLDLFAVLLGGATALLPIFADKILFVGETGLGWLRAAPSMGAIAMALILAHRPPMQRAGRTLLLSVTGFGIATIVFGFSRNPWLSFVALAIAGALDNISIVVRGTLMQMLTPDAMRGRVSSVTTIFIVCSNELGMFESGVVAALIGPVWAVVTGGMGTLAVVGIIALKFPDLRRLRSLAVVESQAQPETLPLGATDLNETSEASVLPDPRDQR